MTDWIDKLAAGLNEHQRAANTARAQQASDDEFVKGEAPHFFGALRAHVEHLAGELTEKLGESMGVVTLSNGPNPTRLVVSNAGGKSHNTATLTISLDIPTKALAVDIVKKGTALYAGSGSQQSRYRLARNPEDRDRIVATLLTPPDARVAYDNPKELASALMQKTFTEELLAPY